jgi:integrase
VALSQVQTTPKTDAGRRTVAIPPHIVPEVAEHLDHFVGAAPDAMVFTGEKGGPLRPHVLQKAWTAAKTSTGLEDLHLHDLRHAGNTWAEMSGVVTDASFSKVRDHRPAGSLCVLTPCGA